MTLFNRDPNDCSNLDELRQWVNTLQELVYAQKEISRIREEQNQMLIEANDKQGREIWLLDHLIAGLKERIAEYETLFSIKSHSSVVRMN